MHGTGGDLVLKGTAIAEQKFEQQCHATCNELLKDIAGLLNDTAYSDKLIAQLKEIGEKDSQYSQ